jgi:hypothetical protein
MTHRTSLITVLLLCLPSLLLADTAAEIDHLLLYVGKAKVTFIRNGQEYTPTEAADHFEKKRQHFVKEIKSAEDFVALAATKSMVSGQPYLVKIRDGHSRECGLWLIEELQRFRSENKESGKDGKAAIPKMEKHQERHSTPTR